MNLCSRLAVFRRHPDFVQLVAWHEGELDERRLSRITRHVLGCPHCSLQAGRIGRALEHYSLLSPGAATAAPFESGVQSLLGILRDPARLSVARERLGRELDFRLAAALQPCFGSYPISLLEHAAAREAAFQTEVNRLAETFLGRKAAACLIAPAKTGWTTAPI